jgi:hypothetical protein
MQTQYKDEINYKFKIGKDEFLLLIRHHENKLKVIIKSEDSIDHYEREFSFKELSEYRVFSLYDDIQEINAVLNENFKNPQNFSASFVDEGNIEIKFDISFIPKTFQVAFIIFKKEKDTNYLIDYLLDEVKKLKVENTELRRIVDRLNERYFFENFESNGTYTSGGKIAGSQRVDDLSSMSLATGICAITPGWIIIEFVAVCTFEEIDIGGWAGDTGLWGPNNGAGASILTSLDKVNWTNVGTIPSNFGNNHLTVKLTKSTAKFIKFQHNTYLGIGYLKIKKI